MKILIANSKEWFIPDEYLKNNHEILIVKEKTIFSYEMVKSLDVPFRVVISEGIGLAKEFGASESYRYVNSILDTLKIYRDDS